MDKMMDPKSIPGLVELWLETKGVPEICIAVLDGQADLSHSCFDGANIKVHPLNKAEKINLTAPMVKHGTHVASVIFGQHNSDIPGIAPNCKGLLIPVFSDTSRKLSQLDLARAIELAVESGAHIINVSGGQISESGEAESWLKNAVEHCHKNNVLLIAAAGNNGCECLHVPASMPKVLAVGAMDHEGKPMNFSNWGKSYVKQGLLAPGKDIPGALPGGGITKQSGTSLATPIVTGVAALLLSIQLQHGDKPNPEAVRQLLLDSVTPCEESKTNDCRLFLAGKLNITQSLNELKKKDMSENVNLVVEPSACECDSSSENKPDAMQLETKRINEESTEVKPSGVEENQTISPSSVEKEPIANHVFSLGTLGYDFGSEARRDAFKQLMAPDKIGDTMVPANPYDARQMVRHFENNLSETKSLIWTLNLELTPIYAIEADGPFARDVYESLVSLLSGQIKSEDDNDYIERVCIPGTITGKTVTLFSGQVVPVISMKNSRGIYGWKVNSLVAEAIAAIQGSKTGAKKDSQVSEEQLAVQLKSFLERVYHSLRNLGTTSHDRALNYAATNAFQATTAFSDSLLKGMELDDIQVEKSPYGRMDSDCWDVLLKFFNP
ncbi:S8 family serine peptidase, partial [Candidatus Pacearchaeota archaeon]|nr:S8 family serine peptidase [Candidatus Pacearchaeota archaeon]